MVQYMKTRLSQQPNPSVPFKCCILSIIICLPPNIDESSCHLVLVVQQVFTVLLFVSYVILLATM